jgi:alanine racemase
MDMCMVDVTDVPDVAADDEVVLIGCQGEEEITADEVAALAGTISYEILCGISARVPRLYLRAGEVVCWQTLVRESQEDAPAPVRSWAEGAGRSG